MATMSLICYIVSTAVASSKNLSILYSRCTLLLYIFATLFSYTITDWYFFEKSIALFNGLIYSNLTTVVFIFFICLLNIFILILSAFYPSEVDNYTVLQKNSIINKHSNEETNQVSKNTSLETHKQEEKNIIFDMKDVMQAKRDHYNIIEYSLLIQFIVTGGITLLSSSDLVTIFLCIELQSYGLYIICTSYRDSESSTGAGLTYFLLGGLSSCIILLGLSFLYVNSGTTGMDGLYLVYNIITSNNNVISTMLVESNLNYYSILYSTVLFTLNYYQYAIQFSLVILGIGFLFKISAAPFHSWSPGVYDAIPTVTTTFVAIIPKISILLLLFDVVYNTWYTTFNYSWTNIFLFSTFLSLIIGSVLGLTQFKIKRLFAYSTISHVAFILLALCVHNVEATQAFLFYIIQYSLSNLNAFLILVLIGYSYIMFQKKTKLYETVLYGNTNIYNDYLKQIKTLSPIEYIDQLKGYFYLNPLLAISLSITLYSFIGVPPLVGFFAKQMVLSSALDNGDIFMCLVAILTSVISAVYYLYIVKHMFFEKSDLILNTTLTNILNLKVQDVLFSSYSSERTNTITSSSWLTGAISILSLSILLFMAIYVNLYICLNILSILIFY